MSIEFNFISEPYQPIITYKQWIGPTLFYKYYVVFQLKCSPLDMVCFWRSHLEGIKLLVLPITLMVLLSTGCITIVRRDISSMSITLVLPISRKPWIPLVVSTLLKNYCLFASTGFDNYESTQILFSRISLRSWINSTIIYRCDSNRQERDSYFYTTQERCAFFKNSYAQLFEFINYDRSWQFLFFFGAIWPVATLLVTEITLILMIKTGNYFFLIFWNRSIWFVLWYGNSATDNCSVPK